MSIWAAYVLIIISNLGDLISAEKFNRLDDALYAQRQARGEADTHAADIVTLGVDVMICLSCNNPEIVEARNPFRFSSVSYEMECFDCYEARKVS